MKGICCCILECRDAGLLGVFFWDQKSFYCMFKTFVTLWGVAELLGSTRMLQDPVELQYMTLSKETM